MDHDAAMALDSLQLFQGCVLSLLHQHQGYLVSSCLNSIPRGILITVSDVIKGDVLSLSMTLRSTCTPPSNDCDGIPVGRVNGGLCPRRLHDTTGGPPVVHGLHEGPPKAALGKMMTGRSTVPV